MATASGQRKRPSSESADIQSANVPSLRKRAAWALLEKHYQKLKGTHLRKLFADDPRRGERLAVEAASVYLDYSKNRITDETLQLLLQLANESGLRGRIDAMFRGNNINVSENRAVLYVAIAAPRSASILYDGRRVRSVANAIVEELGQFTKRRYLRQS